MKSQLNKVIKSARLTTALVLLCGVPSLWADGGEGRHHGRGGPKNAPADSHAYGMSLAEWLETYWRWYQLGADPWQSKVGKVQLMPLPAGEQISGSGTPEDPALLRGKLEITLPPGTPFVLPEFAWIRERYEDGSEDPALDDAVALDGAHPLLKIDGRTVISDRNKADYYVPATAFDPIVEYAQPSSYGSTAALFFQGVGVVGHPLSEGKHIIQLYEPITIPAGAYAGLPDGLGLIYDNTWVINVAKPAEIVPPHKRYLGKSYGEWATAWWQWVMSIPADRNPLIDETGDFAGESQRGPVWFVAGTFGNSAERSFTVPAGKAIFMPLYNWIFGAGVFDCDPTVPGVPCDVPTLQAYAAANTEAAEVLEVLIDGTPLRHARKYRASSPRPFGLRYPENSVVGVPAGHYYPQVTDGYWLLLEPLSKGKHEIRVRVRAPETIFGLIEFEVVHHITVTQSGHDWDDDCEDDDDDRKGGRGGRH